MKYRIIEATTISRLEERIIRLLTAGWELQGGVCVTPATDSSYDNYAQALIKKD